jgi:hypothetical protein
MKKAVSSIEDSDQIDSRTRVEVRRRLADRLGYLLARQWLRIHQHSELDQANGRSDCDRAQSGRSNSGTMSGADQT